MTVVALCTLENDVIHAGYLALALLFFRRRDSLRVQRNRLSPPPPASPYPFLEIVDVNAFDLTLDQLIAVAGCGNNIPLTSLADAGMIRS